MAPQNSTLIDENLDVCSSILNIPEEINRYSPILPPKKKENLNKNMNNNNINNNNYKNNINNNNHVNQDQTKFIQKWEQTEMEQRHCLKYKRQRGTGNNRSGQSRRSRSISLYGVNSTMEQGHKEITIWLGDEPRYVSGVTNKTTCNDIIKALIDDEISNGNYEYCQRLKDGTASRDYSDYVITECWRGIERSYDGIMPILPVWKAWSRVQNEIRLSLKHHKDIQDPSKAFKTNITLSSIRNYICKLLSFGKNKQRKPKSNKSNKPKFNGQCNNNKKETPSKSEEIMMVLMPDMKYGKENSDPSTSAATEVKNSNLKPSTDESKLQAKTKINKEKLYKLSETRSSIRKRRSTCRRKEKKNTHDKRPDSNGDVNNFLRKRKDSSIRSSLRNKLAQKNVEMNELYDREYALTRELTNKCKMYKIQNELYTTSDKNLEMSVGQIQRSIEECAKEIIQTEHELLEVKNVIKHDISIINNLKRLTLDTDPNECGVPIDIEKALKAQPEIEIEPTPTTTDVAAEKMQFVDNIYEFCDNNASVLV